MNANRIQKNYLDKIEQRLARRYPDEWPQYKKLSRGVLPSGYELENPQERVSKAAPNRNIPVPQVYKIELPRNSKYF